jgi:hypothetical protein
MESILKNRPALAAEIERVAEVAGYLWQKGWAERNGGNITVNITEYVDDDIRSMPALSEVFAIGTTLPHLKGCYFYCKGTNMRMRDLARKPMDNTARGSTSLELHSQARQPAWAVKSILLSITSLREILCVCTLPTVSSVSHRPISPPMRLPCLPTPSKF